MFGFLPKTDTINRRRQIPQPRTRLKRVGSREKGWVRNEGMVRKKVAKKIGGGSRVRILKKRLKPGKMGWEK